MKKLTVCLTLFILSVMNLMAQSISKQINDIKRSDLYIHAEATAENESKAYELAEELLAKQIEEYVNEQKQLQKAPNVIVKDVAGKAEKLQMARGEMMRMFLYVKKSDIIPADNSRVYVQPKNQEQPVVTLPATNVGQGTQEESKPSAVSSNAGSNTTLNDEEVEGLGLMGLSLLMSLFDGSLDLDDNIWDTDYTASNSLKPFQQKAIEELLQCRTVGKARAKMDRLRAERKLKRYGAPSEVKHAERCYWLVFDEKGNVLTILGQGGKDRQNYRTGESDELVNYKGQRAIWFTLAN